MATRQANAETSQSMEIDDLLANPEMKANSCNLSDDDQIGILSTLENQFLSFYNNGKLMIPTTLFGFLQFN